MMKSLPVALLAILIGTNAFAAGGCGGGTYSGAGLTPSQRLAKLAEIARGQEELAEINQRNANLDKAIAIAKTFDVVAGAVFSLAGEGFGGVAYSGGKAIGYGIMGDYSAAKEATLDAALSSVSAGFGNAATLEAAAAPTVATGLEAIAGAATVAGFSRDANNAAAVGTEVGDTLGN